MDNTEAMEVLRGILLPYRDRPYAELLGLLKEPLTTTVLGKSGATYQIEVLAVWDDNAFWGDKHNRNLRVWGSVDDGGWRAFSPLSETFIMAPDGSFVGE